jgi:SNF2 family DNA or RNA helicase
MGQRTLIIAPLSVARQTVREAKKIKIAVKYVRHQSEIDDSQIFITNYEMLDEFDPAQFGAVVLDESSILKSLDSKTDAS